MFGKKKVEGKPTFAQASEMFQAALGMFDSLYAKNASEIKSKEAELLVLKEEQENVENALVTLEVFRPKKDKK